jgi:Protein of unknown function (DUF1194)
VVKFLRSVMMLGYLINKRVLFLIVAGLLYQAVPVHAASEPIYVDVQIALLVDASRSVDSNRFLLQKNGYTSMFNDSLVFSNFISKGKYKRIAICLVYWSAPKKMALLLPWTLIDSESSAKAFGGAVAKAAPFGFSEDVTGHQFNGTTAPGSAIAFALPLFSENGFKATRNVINLSGDGIENDGIPTKKMRDDALAGGINAVNSMPIGSAALKAWFIENIQGGTGSFTLTVKDYPDLLAAAKGFLERTISPEN